MVTEMIDNNLIAAYADTAQIHEELINVPGKLHERLGDRVSYAEELELVRATLKSIETEIMVACKDDGTPLIDGKNEATRAAQLTAYCAARTDYVTRQEKVRELSRALALTDADIEYWRMRSSHARSRSSLLAAQLNYLAE